ncbi:MULTISPECIES: LytTR family DNA-binding domain-containing protein [unclassified Brevundimonas]|uniref:LytTR family DNA-binding domain-containing protein n=1 Tax=unclassified Brevundimonas TaxID=2622653 RepID=UPI003F8E70F2
MHRTARLCPGADALSQAITGLKDVEGAQTHRSWWVARASLAGVVEDGRKLRLRLTDGLEAPVSRARVGVLREEGWLTATSANDPGWLESRLRVACSPGLDDLQSIPACQEADDGSVSLDLGRCRVPVLAP